MSARIFAEHNRRWLTLAAVSFGLFMIMLDNTVVNVALPSIQFEAALLVAAAIAVVGAIVAFVLVRPHGGAGSPRSDAAVEPVT